MAREGGGGLRDALAAAGVWSGAALVAAAFVALLADLVGHGLSQLSLAFLTEAPRDAGRSGGIAPMIVSTGLVLGVCLLAALPFGLGTALLLSEFTRRGSAFGRGVRRSLDVLAGVPSIVFGLFGSALLGRALGLGFSILSGGLTLAFMVLPILIRSTEAGLRAVPDEQRRAAAALGLSRTTTLFSILLPAAAPGLLAGLVLGTGRALAETAALLFTSGYVDRMPASLLDSGRTLSVHVYDLAMNVPGGEGRAYGTALVLVAGLAGLNAIAAWVLPRALGAGRSAA